MNGKPGPLLSAGNAPMVGYITNSHHPRINLNNLIQFLIIMQKIALFTFILLTCFSGSLLAGTTDNGALRADTTIAVKQAEKDAHGFKLSKADLKIFRQNRKNSTSDFFKPTTTSTANAAMLQDSVYVKAYRAEAYHNALGQRTTAHYILVDGFIVVDVAVAVYVLFHYAIHN